jgi:tripeptidyl-peptidase-1
MTLEQITDLIAPLQSEIDIVTQWLTDNGVWDTSLYLSRDFLKARMTTAQATKLFNIEFHTYRHVSGKTMDLTVGPYSVPVTISSKLDFVSGLVGFPTIDTPQYKTQSVPAADKSITPAVIRARYNVSSTTVSTNPKNSHAVAEFQAQYYSPADLKKFWATYVPFAPEQTVAQVVGFNDPTSPGIEASLDIEYLMGVAPGATTWFYSMKQFDFWSDLTTWVGELNNETDVPWVHSVSYGSQGDYPSDAYRDRLNSEFQELGTRGVSILFASGDNGAGCQGVGLNTRACDCTFYPSFPATCPYTTSVGATAFINGNTGAEEAVFLFKSGGGFSQVFGIPSYQASSVSQFLRTANLPESCAFNASGRATPDVGALGDEYFEVLNGGSTIQVGGTSASTPAFSAIITLLNDIRLSNGKSTLGFLNTWLYGITNGNAFFDVTEGDNKNTRCCVSGANDGFECTPGWDPVTGLGTPNFEVLKTLV